MVCVWRTMTTPAAPLKLTTRLSQLSQVSDGQIEIERLNVCVSEPNKVKYTSAASDLDLNTPLVQDESTDPLKMLFKKK